MRYRKLMIWILVVSVVLVGLLTLLAYKPAPERITYGMSFNTPYARELGLDWQETYDAILDDLGVRHLRLAAHWPMVEPFRGIYNFTELDYQIRRAEEVGAEVVLAVGRRLPRWPECHVPGWVKELTAEEQTVELLGYVEAVVNRYKNNPAVKIWQVENEPFLRVFAFEHCGPLNLSVLDQEIALVRKLDASRPILITDSGNLGTWHQAYRRGDMFGTSVYVHFWNPDLGPFRTILPPAAYRMKENINALLFSRKPTLLIELSAEPWLLEPIVDTPLPVQFSRMNVEKFADILKYAERTRFDRQYLWGAEWWYWLLLRGEPAMWEFGRSLFVKETTEHSVIK